MNQNSRIFDHQLNETTMTQSIFAKPITEKEFDAIQKDVLTISLTTQSKRFDFYSVTFKNGSKHQIMVKNEI